MKTDKTIVNIIFDAGKGSTQSTSREGTVGEPYGKLPTPVRAGHSFEGWYLGNERIDERTVLLSESDVRLQARWVKSAERKRLSSLKRQKIASIALVGVAALLIIAWAIVAQVIAIYHLDDVYVDDNGVEQSDRYVIKRVDGVYKLLDEDGNVMQNREGTTDIFIAEKSKNQYKIDPQTGAAKLSAYVDRDSLDVDEGLEGTIVLLYPEIQTKELYSIKVTHADGSMYEFRRVPDDDKDNPLGYRIYIVGFEDALFSYDDEKFAYLRSECGWAASDRKLTVASDVAKLADGTIDYAAYGLDDPQVTFTITGIRLDDDGNADIQTSEDEDGNTIRNYRPDPARAYTVLLGDLIPSKDGIYARVQGKDAVYIMASSYSTAQMKLEELVVAQAFHTVPVNSHSMANSFFLYHLENWRESENIKNAVPVVGFSYTDLQERQNTMDQAQAYLNLGADLMPGYSINTINAIAVMTSLYSIQYVRCAELGISKMSAAEKNEMLEKYDLDSDIYYLTYGMDLTPDDEERAYAVNTVLISKTQNENGNHYIASLTYDMVVEVSPKFLPFLNWTASNWYERYFAQININYVNGIDFQFGEKTYQFTTDNSLCCGFYIADSKDSAGNDIRILQAVDMSVGTLKRQDGKVYYVTNADSMRHDVVAWVDLNNIEAISYKEAMADPARKNVIYVEESFYFKHTDGKNYTVRYEDVIERDGKFYYEYTDKTTGKKVEKTLTRSFGKPIYRYDKGLETSLELKSDNLQIYSPQYGENGGWLDYTATYTYTDNATGAVRTETLSALENFKRLHLALMNYTLSGDVDEKRFTEAMGVDVETFLKGSHEADATITIYAEDYASVLNGFRYFDKDGNERVLYTENNEKNLVIRFYGYTDRQALVTIQTISQDASGNWVVDQKEEIGKFFVQNAYLDQLEKSVEMLLNGQVIPE